MLKFKKEYNSKIISLSVAVVFFLNSTVYGIDLSNKIHLRVPVGQKETQGRVLKTMLSNQLTQEKTSNPIGKSLMDNTIITKNRKGQIIPFVKRHKILSAIFASLVVIIPFIYVIFNRVDYFSFNKNEISLISNTLAGEDLKEFDIHKFIDKLNVIKSQKITNKEVRLHCKELLYSYLPQFSKIIDSLDHVEFEAELPTLLNFITSADINGLNSVGTKWLIDRTKIKLINIIIHRMKDPVRDAKAFNLIIEALGPLIEYSDNIRTIDQAYLKYFPNIQPELVLNIPIRVFSYNILRSLTMREHLPEWIKEKANKEIGSRAVPKVADVVDVAQRFFYVYGAPEDIDFDLGEIERLEKDDVHYIPISKVRIIEEIRRFPKDIREYCINSAQAHNLPPRLLVLSAMPDLKFIETNVSYTIEKGLDVLAVRKKLPESTVNFFHFIIPDKIERLSPGVKINDFLWGILLNGNSSTGVCQLRPSWIRRYNGFSRFNINTAGFSNRHINWMLLEPGYNIEATAKMWRETINETIEFKKRAMLYNKPVDIAGYKDEGFWEMVMYDFYPKPSAEYYKQLPNPEIFGKEDWVLNIYHPLYFAWSEYPIEAQKDIIISGILDDKPIEFIVNSLEDINKLKRILGSKDPVLRNAAKRALERYERIFFSRESLKSL